MAARLAEIEEVFGVLNGNDTGGDPIAAAPRGELHATRLGAYRPGALRRLVNHVRWKRSSVRRVRVDLDDVVAARVDVLDARRPHADMPPPLNQRGLTTADLGAPGTDPDEYLWGDESDGTRVRRATGLIARGAELEQIAILCLDFGGRSPVELAATRVCPVYKGQRVRVATDDWKPGAVAGRATRHYVVGDASEIRELADVLAARDPRLRALLDADVGGDLDPARAPAVREVPPTPSCRKTWSARRRQK